MHNGATITSLDEFASFILHLDWERPIAADVETYKIRPTQPGALLLGVAISGYDRAGTVNSIYIVFHHYNKVQKRFIQYLGYRDFPIVDFFSSVEFVGWNVPFDRAWLDHFITKTKWRADGRILWHLQNNDFMIRGFGLKLAQKKLLGWEEANDKALEQNVRLAGGQLARGDHYLADLDMLSHYACLDTYSTLMAYEKLAHWITGHDYWGFASEMLEFSIILYEAANQGIPVDEAVLYSAAALYKDKRDRAAIEIREICKDEINAIESAWKVRKLASYKTVRGQERFLADYEGRGRRFNPASAQQRALLLHEILEFPVREKTGTGQPKTDRANLAAIPHNSAQALVTYSECKKVAEQAQTYLSHVSDAKLYTNYDVCGTVSGRLSGFKPSVLNMPFNEAEVMRSFTTIPGFVGIHADLAAIEPCVLAHYTGDPTLLKCYRDGMGDIYLDLALDIFPGDDIFRKAYDPTKPLDSTVKKVYKDLRAVCKIIHLAVSYTGTYITVAKNLSKAGFPTTQSRAMSLVELYWKKFAWVKSFDNKLKDVYRNRQYIRNLVGRIIQVPHIYEKDLMNRLIQSSAHDLLRLWVMEIIRLFEKRGVEWRHWLPDLHDSTTFMVKEGQEELARLCYMEALKSVEERVQMSVPLKCELKFCKTLAGLKIKE
jgi:DNA polymerase I-like protein with 3'-5' exonuclease and polymerase domains